MPLQRLILSGLVVLSLGGCAGDPALQALQPERGGGAYVLSRSPVVAASDPLAQHVDDDNSIVYAHPLGADTVGAGVLVAPLGVVANVATIGRTRKGDADRLRGRLVITPREVFVDAALRQGLDLLPDDGGAQRPRVTPYLFLSQADETTVLAAAALIVESAPGPEKCIGRYVYQLPVEYSLDRLARLDAQESDGLRRLLEDGFVRLLFLLDVEDAGRMRREPPITFRSRLLSPGSGQEVTGSLISDDGHVVWVRSFSGVYGVRKSEIDYRDGES